MEEKLHPIVTPTISWAYAIWKYGIINRDLYATDLNIMLKRDIKGKTFQNSKNHSPGIYGYIFLPFPIHFLVFLVTNGKIV